MKIKFFYEIKEEDKISNYQIIDLIIKNRKISNVEEFLQPKNPFNISLFDFNDSFKTEFQKSLEILKKVKEKNQMVVVYTDYDADGVTGGAILWETLYYLGFRVMPYVPNRKTEGYGFSFVGIDKVVEKYNPALIISVDHGITKVKEIEYAKSKGLKIIITDHHLKGEIIPKADSIFHIPSVSGAGVSYFFSKEIFNNFQKKFDNCKYILQKNFLNDYLSLASIGTIADLVPLIGPSRSIVKYGLENFSKISRLGIKYILKEAKIENKKITPYEIAFIIAPRINAVGRLKDATDALRLLCTKKEERAKNLALYLGQKNRQRQNLVEKALAEAKKTLAFETKNFTFLPKIIFLSSENWEEGIIGIVAAKIVEEFYRPTLVLTKNNGFYKGSARSIPQFHITNFLRSLNKYLIDVGGHSQAAGFTLDVKNLFKFKKEVKKMAETILKEDVLKKEILVDLKIPISKINIKWVKILDQLQPFGIGNQQPIFFSEGKIINIKFLGKENKHLKIYLSDEKEKSILEFIGFNQGKNFKNFFRNQKINIVYHLEIDRWKGKEKVLGKIIHLGD